MPQKRIPISWPSPKATAAVEHASARKPISSAAMDEMLDYKGPFVLDVQVPYVEHVLPMIPSGHTVDDIILE